MTSRDKSFRRKKFENSLEKLQGASTIVHLKEIFVLGKISAESYRNYFFKFVSFKNVFKVFFKQNLRRFNICFTSHDLLGINILLGGANILITELV